MSCGANLRETVIGFIRGAGIAVRETVAEADWFLPGLDIRSGAIVFDPVRWEYPGDMLHEAGHLAVTAAKERSADKLAPTAGDEMAAIAWSYAAAVHLNLEPEIVFHANGYRGWGSLLAENFAAGRYFGVPLLHCYGMTVEPRRAQIDGLPPYPHMLRWLR